jgi:pre-rRNA-processing protein TSR3
VTLRILVLQHHKENRKKCTVTAIQKRADVEVEVLRPGPAGHPPLVVEGGILLAVDAPPLVPADRTLLEASPAARLVLVDANWVKVPAILARLSSRGPLAARSLPADVRTAYPRRSKLFEDPAGGLATVEAIAAAMAILGAWDPTILEGYNWTNLFLERNPRLFPESIAGGVLS